MPNDLRNWTYADIKTFLHQHHFILMRSEGSHHFYQGQVDGITQLTHVQRHSSRTIPPKTMSSIVHLSGIPKDVWIEWGNAGSKRLRRQIQYPGAEKWREPD